MLEIRDGQVFEVTSQEIVNVVSSVEVEAEVVDLENASKQLEAVIADKRILLEEFVKLEKEL